MNHRVIVLIVMALMPQFVGCPATEGTSQQDSGTQPAPSSADSGSPDAGPDAVSEDRRTCTVVPEGCIAAGCEAHACATKDSVYDEFMCLRSECSADGGCDGGFECREVEYSPVSCGYEGENGECICGGQGATVIENRCMPVAE